MLAANSGNFVQLGRVAIQVDNDHGLGRTIKLEGTAQGGRIALTHVSAHRFFKLVDILTQRRDPVFLKCVMDVLQFIALVRHMRAGQQKPFILVCLLYFSVFDARCFYPSGKRAYFSCMILSRAVIRRI